MHYIIQISGECICAKCKCKYLGRTILKLNNLSSMKDISMYLLLGIENTMFIPKHIKKNINIICEAMH